MNNKLYVGSLNFAVTQQDLLDFFMGGGTVLEAIVVTDRSTGNSRGFGFVTMASEGEALDAIEKLQGKELLGQEVSIKLALDKEPRPQRNFEHRGRDREGYRGGQGGSGYQGGSNRDSGRSGGNRRGGFRGR
jgi:RNA recognition motif-containing protein